MFDIRSSGSVVAIVADVSTRCVEYVYAYTRARARVRIIGLSILASVAQRFALRMCTRVRWIAPQNATRRQTDIYTHTHTHILYINIKEGAHLIAL